MPIHGRKLAFIALVLATLGPATIIVLQAQATEAEARQVFETVGCINCHNGGQAPDWEGTLGKIRDWASRYGSLDEAVQAEYTFSGGAASFDELMAQMHQFTPTATDQDIQLLSEFFRNVFQEAKTATPTPTTTTTTTTPTTTPPPGGPATVTETVTETVTISTTITETQTIPVTVETTITKIRVVTERVEGQPTAGGYPLAFATIIAVAALAALLLLRFKV